MMGVPHPPELRERARALAEQRNLTRVQIGEVLGVPVGTVVDWTRGLGAGPGELCSLPAGRAWNAPLREAFLASGLSQDELARRLDWWRQPSPSSARQRRAKRVPDQARVAITLGMRPTISTNGRRYWRRTVSLDVAEQMARAIGVDPREVGL